MHDYELDDVIDAMQEAACQAGEVIIAEGEPGELFYILEEGAALITYWPYLLTCIECIPC